MVWCLHAFGSGATVSLETFKYGMFHLSHILLFASSAGDCIYQVSALTGEILFHHVCPVTMEVNFPTMVQVGTLSAFGVFAGIF